MNWLTSTCSNLTPKHLIRSLIAFSLLLFTGAGLVWACADYGYDDTSSFAPEYFVHKKYSPFFYDSYNHYYYGADTAYLKDHINRFVALTEQDWKNYLGKQLTPAQIRFLLFKSNQKQVDSVRARVYNKMNGQGKTFFNYLPLVKDCETYSVNEDIGWYEKTPRKPVAASIERRIINALTAYKDPFIRQRLWFQLVRYQYFRDTTGVKTGPAFYKYEKEFPRNLLYYRALGYLAGSEYAQKRYSQANYHYSLCYNYTWEMLIPSQWSFHPQEEADWNETLKLAKTPEEKITLWHLLGIQYDERRALQEIVKLNPRSDKIDLLLSRMINMLENGGGEEDKTKFNKELAEGIRLTDQIASRTDLPKPLYWHLAAGYLHYLHQDYQQAEQWYSKAMPLIPKADISLQAQYKLLNVLLYTARLKKINDVTEQKLVEPLNWLADLRDSKRLIPHLRFNDALKEVTDALGNIYLKQNNKVKANCFVTVKDFYVDSIRIDSAEKLILKSNKTAFEKAMLRYYSVTAPDLFYHQAILAVYKENIPSAINFMDRAEGLKDTRLPADPFYSRLNDCHDCEFSKSKKEYTPISFLKKVSLLQANLRAGKQTYQSALMLGGAYYNLTHYGNSRMFFQTGLTGQDASQPDYYPEEYQMMFTSQHLAKKYYSLALDKAATAEQKARAAFLLSKCERNDYYNQFIGKEMEGEIPPAGRWFAQLKNNYSNTAYYREVLKECGYFRTYLAAKGK